MSDVRSGTRVWPVRRVVSRLNKWYAEKAVTLTRNVPVVQTEDVPTDGSFSRFRAPGSRNDVVVVRLSVRTEPDLVGFIVRKSEIVK